MLFCDIPHGAYLLTTNIKSSKSRALLLEFRDDLYNINSSRRGKMFSSASAGAAGVFPDIL
jgi:hypothetical protein